LRDSLKRIGGRQPPASASESPVAFLERGATDFVSND
jgi:hypothetical protein